MLTHPASLLLDISKNFSNHRQLRDDSWYGYQDGDHWGAIPFAVNSLYRGQTAHHYPMLPSIARGLRSPDIAEISKSSIPDQANLIFRLAQSAWFQRELKYHPIFTHAGQQKLDLDPIALAQHYEIPTGYLDLSDDFNVSAFFATCRKTQHGWEPVATGVGVIYRVDLSTLETPFGRYIPLGPQPLPRPTEQCAWVTELPICHSFEGWPNVSKLHFEHDRDVGEHFLNMFSSGEKLFPPDPLADVASEILTCREIPIDLVDAVLDSFINDPFGPLKSQFPTIRKEVAKLATLIGNRRLLTDQQVASLLANEAWSEKMLAEVKAKWRVVRRVPIPPNEAKEC